MSALNDFWAKKEPAKAKAGKTGVVSAEAKQAKPKKATQKPAYKKKSGLGIKNNIGSEKVSDAPAKVEDSTPTFSWGSANADDTKAKSKTKFSASAFPALSSDAPAPNQSDKPKVKSIKRLPKQSNEIAADDNYYSNFEITDTAPKPTPKKTGEAVQPQKSSAPNSVAATTTAQPAKKKRNRKRKGKPKAKQPSKKQKEEAEVEALLSSLGLDDKASSKKKAQEIKQI
eukprot:TRINITY_DN22008_c0_g1_i1.p1 TRINITY_DN22008_c0_g1~~TRINITY_DN22008_c0_g1_i1.p1  ORF type:complete len:228 (+),score=76.03 TRINITY_DN22008_c0_g1_i1:46-729(+)